MISGWKEQYQRALPILEKIAEAEEDVNLVIAIDGRCASGKSTLAHFLSEITGAGVVHMDDFFLPLAIRTKERLSEPGGNVHYERFRQEVLPRLRSEQAFSYPKFSCDIMDIDGEREVEASKIRIVEGAYSMHPIFGQYADIRVFSDIDNETQLSRILQRNGADKLELFRNRWIPMEEYYIEKCSVLEQADILLGAHSNKR